MSLLRVTLTSCVAVVAVIFLGVSISVAPMQGQSTQRVSGFLGDYSDLELARDDPNMVVYRKAEGVVRPYTQFLIDPVLIYFGSEAAGRAVDPDELKRLADYLRDAAVSELQDVDRFEVVDTPGPGVLRIRAAITDVDPAGGVLNVATRAAAVATTPPGVGFLIPRLDLGSASIEVEMRDAQSEERLVVVVATERGRRFFSGFRGLKAWGDVESAFRSWAERLRETLERVQEG